MQALSWQPFYWPKAEFTGDEIDSNFTSKAFAEEIKDLQPGDSIVIKVAVKNGSKQGTDWYVSNEVLQSLEDSSPANGGAYTYELTWKGAGDLTTLYSSKSVGGENVTAAGEGLHEATDNLEQFFYLDHLQGCSLILRSRAEGKRGRAEEQAGRMSLPILRMP